MHHSLRHNDQLTVGHVIEVGDERKQGADVFTENILQGTLDTRFFCKQPKACTECWYSKIQLGDQFRNAIEACPRFTSALRRHQ